MLVVKSDKRKPCCEAPTGDRGSMGLNEIRFGNFVSLVPSLVGSPVIYLSANAIAFPVVTGVLPGLFSLMAAGIPTRRTLLSWSGIVSTQSGIPTATNFTVQPFFSEVFPAITPLPSSFSFDNVPLTGVASRLTIPVQTVNATIPGGSYVGFRVAIDRVEASGGGETLGVNITAVFSSE